MVAGYSRARRACRANANKPVCCFFNFGHVVWDFHNFPPIPHAFA